MYTFLVVSKTNERYFQTLSDVNIEVIRVTLGKAFLSFPLTHKEE